MKIYENNPPQDPAVSVLVPVCNVERYLPQCLDSLLAQTLKNIEIIGLNDGSTDNSLSILLDYQKRDSRIRVVDKPNAGYGATMNLGISLARGQYVGILESDDFAEPSMYKKLYRFARRHDCDLVKCSYYEHSEQGDVAQDPFVDFPKKKVFDPRENLWITCVLPIIWAALYRRRMLIDNNIRFNETPGASFQDTSFVFQCWASARRVAILPQCLIHYRVDNTGSSVKSAKKVFAVNKEYELSEQFLKEDPARFEAFGKILHLLKLGTYKWNYERIADECKLDFITRMSEEYRIAQADNMLDRAFFTDWDWQVIHEVMDDPAAFCAKYPDQFYGIQ